MNAGGRRASANVWGHIQLLSSLAQGCWQAPFSWVLYTCFGFSAEEIALLIGAQLLVQIGFEIPSGAFAERASPRAMLLASFAFMALYAALFLGAVVVLEPPHAAERIRAWVPAENVHSFTFRTALFAELCFGFGNSLLSGTVQAWRADAARRDAGTDSDYAKALDAIASNRLIWIAMARAAVGALAFLLATLKRGSLVVPWALALFAYLLTTAVVAQRVPGREKTQEHDEEARFFSRQTFDRIVRQANRAASYLRESRSTLRLFLQTSLVHVLFWSTQVFWVVLLVEGLGLTRTSSVWIRSVRVSYFVIMWVGGEFASAAGARLLRRISAPLKARAIAVWTFAYTCALAVQIAGVVTGEKKGLRVIAIGYIVAKVLEGELRREMELLSERAIVSDRATHQSIQAFFRAVVGFCVIAAAGNVINSDVIAGYVFLFATAACATLLFALFPFDDELLGVPSLEEAPDVVWRNRRFWAFVGAVFTLAVVFGALSLKARDGVLWAKLNGGRTVSVKHVRTDSVRPNAEVPNADDQPSDAAPAASALAEGWELSVASEKVRCRTVPAARTGALAVSVEGAIQPVLRHDLAAEWLEFGLEPNREAIVSAPTKIDRPFRCFIGEVPPVTVLPTRVEAFVTERGEDDIWLLAEGFVAAGMLALLFWIGIGRSLRLLTEAQRLAPVASALKFGGTDALAEIHPRRFMEGLSDEASGLTKFTSQLGTSNLLVGAFNLRDGAAVDLWAVHYVREKKGDDVRARTAPSYPRWMRPLISSVVAQQHVRIDRPAAVTIPVASLSPEISTSIAEWPLDWASPATSLAPSDGRDGGCISVGLSVAKLGNDQLVGFAIGLYPAESVPRYIDPIERMLLRMLADVGQTQHRAALFRFESYTKFHDVGRWMGRILRKLDPIARSEGLSEDVEKQLFRLRALVEADAESAHILMGKRRADGAAFELRERLERDVTILEGGTKSKWGGDVQIPFSWIGGRCSLPGESWINLRRVLHELIENASRHAASEDIPDVVIHVDVRVNETHVNVTLKNDIPPTEDRRSTTGGPGLGLSNARTTIERMHGAWIEAGPRDGQFVVQFSFPMAVAHG